MNARPARASSLAGCGLRARALFDAAAPSLRVTVSFDTPAAGCRWAAAGLPHFGVYQMGEAQARSCTVMGTSGGIFTPKRAASYAVQRGVGISITRA